MPVLSEPRQAGLPTSPRAKLTLAAEILATSRRVRRLLGEHELVDVLDRLTGDGAARAPDRADRALAWRLARAVTRTLKLPGTESRCLVQSLVLIALLSRRGIEASLVIGVRSAPGFAAHAWVEHQNVPVLPDSGYPPLVRLPEQGVHGGPRK